MASTTKPQDEIGSIEFELTDFNTARQALEDLPPGVEEVRRLRPGYWEQHRRPPAPADRALSGVSLEWMARLPPAVRPGRTAERYPRVVNQIAQNWTIGSQCSATFDDLLMDRRGGRLGFPYDVEVELKQLREYRQVLTR